MKKWNLNKLPLYFDNTFVDSLSHLVGGTVTVFQRIDSGFVRISTNVLNSDSIRAVGTYIPNESPVVKSVLNRKTYYGRAYVVNDWYITAYEPIFQGNKIIGMLYVGDKEKDLAELRKILYSLNIGESGYPFVFDNEGNAIIHPKIEGQNWKDSTLFKLFTKSESGVLSYIFNDKQKTAAYSYYPEFDLYIATCVETGAETREFIRNTIIGASAIAMLVVLILSFFLYYLTTERIYRFLRELEISNKKLSKAKEALKQSEERFQKLFDSTGDDIFVTDENESIIEINQATCNSLGYTREELLKLKMSDIKTLKYVDKVAENRRKIYELGTYTFESEHVSKDGKVIQVEFTSRVVNYNNERLILSVVRNVGERKEVERQILSSTIRAEERERERFARDMHDGIGPLLSTIKLYVNELLSANLDEEERKELVRYSNELIDEAVSSTRNISNNLMPRIIHKYGLVKAIDAFCEKINKTNKISISFEHEKIHEHLDKNLELILFRVISELINNTIKHANASKILLLLINDGEKIKLFLKDDGVGFNVNEIMNSEQKGMGLKNIISRIKSINGFYKFDSSPGNGFSIKIEIFL
ncbi:MAG: hypothetical protein A2265_00185 [Bacteroidetes bacterium RIFOXYA12_FULL_33_9]|nr:MAG: hypothetical protein A2265_00185 [Bacteroidetes bacterium RIFOXYA12_FULL_33_9]